MKRFLVIIAAGLMVLSTACQAAPTPTPTETATSESAPAPTVAPTLPPTWTPTPQPSPTPADTATPAPTPSPVPNDVWVDAVNGLNLRADAKSTAKLVTTLKHQQHLVVVGTSVGPDATGTTWQNVRTDAGQTGWVSSQFLTKTNPAATPTPAPAAAATQAPAATTPAAVSGGAWTTSPDGLNLRAQAATTSNVVAILPFGTHLALLSGPTGPDASGITWQNVRTDDGKTGYVSTQFISATKPTTTATPTPAATTPVTATSSATTTTSVGDVWVVATDGLNLRAQPNSTAAVVATLTYGQRLTALAPKSTPDAAGIAWQNVRTQANQTGWAAANYLSAASPVTTNAAPASGTLVTGAANELLQRLNLLRDQNKLAPVTSNAQLAAAAQRHSQDMAKTGNISHTGSDGTTPQQRITAAGYPGQHQDEVIYGGPASVNDAWYYWTNNRLQTNILLNPRYTDVGIAVVNNGGHTYYTIDFGGP